MSSALNSIFSRSINKANFLSKNYVNKGYFEVKFDTYFYEIKGMNTEYLYP